ncbi:trans-aconitate 2-methyltransferase [Synechococcus sp. PCC 7336]|uniref:class I SAM-dependent methyltransferase n=1 Tax=Synechococcus sp. PCC 7336 TaxID=195250 RepID=UPI000349D630|nr:class I SAM-dependent methyltransferase [Synechococcus sp. PCC 7336]
MFRGYKSRVKHQIQQFEDPSKLKKLPPIYHYYTKKFVIPRLKEVFGITNALDFYISHIAEILPKTTSQHIMSIGSGDCNVEIKIAKGLVKSGIKEFVLECHELSPIRLGRAQQLVKEENLQQHFSFHETDFNDFQLNHQYSAFIAHHTLHHIVELESLFEQIVQFLEPNGRFLTIDMIGRNGHMRWPEALEFIEKMWDFLPDKYKFQHQFQKYHEKFVNWNCAHKGFEGIRAQDILKLLVDMFECEKFYAFGNLPDIFIERGYGHNFDVEDKADTAFIDFIEHVNDTLIDCGYLKPTMMFGIFSLIGSEKSEMRVYKDRTPECCIRHVDIQE